MRYVFCTIAIGQKYIDSAVNLAKQLNDISNEHHFIIVTDNTEHVVDNVTFIEVPKDKKLFIQNYFNYNLKYLPIKHSSELDFDYIIFIDADWSLGDEYSTEKVHNVLEFMEINKYDFCLSVLKFFLQRLLPVPL